MLVDEELTQFSPVRDSFLTIGVFDGVHLGHRHLISGLHKQAHEKNMLAGVVTFRQHPLELFAPESRLPYLTTLSQREALLKAAGADFVVFLSFTRELAGITARDFAALLVKYLKMRGLVVGPDFALGKDRGGTVPVLRELGAEMGFSVSSVPPLVIDGEVASSTVIRKALALGDMEKVTKFLGRPFSLQGKVVSGQQRGTGFGIPTANLEIDFRQAVPPQGVYATLVLVEGNSYPAVTNIGLCPTFGEKNPCTIETHIIDYTRSIYGKEMELQFMKRLRDEKRFDNVEDLKKQIDEDVRHSREILSPRNG